MFAGFTLAELKNELVTLDLLTFEYTTTGNTVRPPLRINHSMVAINDNLYLFGGDSYQNKMNDLWSFDIRNEKWTVIKGYGEIPKARSHHAGSSMGDSMIIWGGTANEILLNDMYKYSVSTNIWENL